MPPLRDGVVKRGSTWSYVIRVTDPRTGLSKPKWVGGFATEGEAKAARDEARVAARRGQYVERNRMTVGEYLALWIDGHAVEIKPKTLAGYRDLINRYVLPHIGNTRIQAVKPSTLSKLYRDLLASGGVNGRPLSVRTVDQVHAILRKAFNDAVRVDEVLAVNPVERAKRPRRERSAVREVWSADQLRRFLAYASRHRLHPFFHVAAYTGARRGELLNLRWSDVDFERGEVTIRGSASVIGGDWVEGSTKGGYARVVSIDSGTVDILKALRARQNEERLVAGQAWSGEDHVFTRGLGQPVHPDTVSQLMPRLVKAHNKDVRESDQLPPARLHDLRHVHATTLLLAGVPVHVVAERLGHADPSITLRVYAHVIRQRTAAVADIFAREIDVSGSEERADDDEDPPALALAPR